jgi:hypothetical protein
MKIKDLVSKLLELDQELVVLHRNYDQEWWSNDYSAPYVYLENLKFYADSKSYSDEELYKCKKPTEYTKVEVALISGS